MKGSSLVLFGIIVLVACLSGSAVYGESFSGDLTSSNSGLDGVGDWVNPGPATISWVITDMGSYYNYEYTLSVPQNGNAISHFIVGVSDTFEASNFWNSDGPFGVTEIGDFDQHNGNPDMPGTLHGLKFDETSGTTLTISFDSNRMPVWGDFYAKGGGNPTKQVWNAGLGIVDPTAPPSNGTVMNHILVPNCVTTPEPSSFCLMGMALLGLSFVRKARRFKAKG